MARQIAEVLRELSGGQTYDEINARLNEVVQAVIETRKVGELSVKLKIKPNGEGSVFVQDTVTSKVPEPTRGETVFFTLSDGSLVRSDPRQQKMPFREVQPEPETPAREAS